jgi:TetR/AcrR family transcriptional repressor of nem operon
MPKSSHHEALLAAGLRTMFEKGYVGATVRDITTAASAPQGSFTNHFSSKEKFASKVLDRYFEHVRGLMDAVAADGSLTPRERLVRYLDLVTDRLVADEFTRGCLIGDFSIEGPGHSESLRRQLKAIYQVWTDAFAAWIAEAQNDGEISTFISATDLADFLITGWEGAILRMKVERDSAPLNRFRAVAFTTVFRMEQP